MFVAAQLRKRDGEEHASCRRCEYAFEARLDGDACPRCTPGELENDLPPRLVALLATFPALRDAPRTTTRELAVWNCSRGAEWAVIFVLSVYNTRSAEWYGLPHFDLHKAMGRWDEGQRGAFAAWAVDPWWC